VDGFVVGFDGVFFWIFSPFLATVCCVVFWVFFKSQSSPNISRKAPSALLLLWVKKEQLSDGVSWMNVSVTSWPLATLLNARHWFCDLPACQKQALTSAAS